MSPKVSKEHMEQRRAYILNKAKEVFIEHGYEKTTMKHIMEKANISRGGLYQYFSNKEDVYETILDEALKESMNNSAELLKDNVASHWELLLSCMFGKDKKPNDKMDPMGPSNLEFFISGRKDQRRREYGKVRYENGVKIYRDIIEQGQERGEFQPSFQSEVLARSIVTFLDGLALDHTILPSEDLKIKEQAELFVEFLKIALGVKK
ncbi:TetR/AcrR family transcriptional regulator [Sutcliffiella horikoshii]|nr:TetR/AcrR family transcriptional regulator [Sutcliffiella horikoshii]